MRAKKFLFDTARFPFRELFECLFETKDLEHLHLAYPEQSACPVFDKHNDDQTFFHRKFYDRVRAGWSEFETPYRALAHAAGKLLMGDSPFLYQRCPTFRIQLPGNLAVGEFHRDLDYNHPRGELNFTLPVTRAYETNAIWIESEPGRGDYGPITLEYGELANFDGSLCTHGNYVNETGECRVSFDFRVLLLSDYEKAERKKSIGIAQVPFVIGGYYSIAEGHPDPGGIGLRAVAHSL